jgi:hypothetical protein
MTAAPTDAFVPLTTAKPAANGRDDFRVLIASGPKQVQPFRTKETHAPATTGGSNHSPGCEPRVTLDRNGDRITGIRVQCSCGQVIELVCRYD